MAEQKELRKASAPQERSGEIKALKKELQRKEKAMAEMAALLGAAEKVGGLFLLEDAEGLTSIRAPAGGNRS